MESCLLALKPHLPLYTYRLILCLMKNIEIYIYISSEIVYILFSIHNNCLIFFMIGTLPTTLGDVENVKACKRGFFSCCDSDFQIEVKNCGTFNVYHLSPLTSCFGRYCTGTIIDNS